MAPRRGNETGDDPDEIVVHITGIPQRRRRSGHDRRHLCSAARVEQSRTSWLVCTKLGSWTCRRSAAMRVNAALSSTTTESAFWTSRFAARRLR